MAGIQACKEEPEAQGMAGMQLADRQAVQIETLLPEHSLELCVMRRGPQKEGGMYPSCGVQ